MREKLIELITEALQRKEGTARIVGQFFTEKIADHLIANGVTIQQWISVEERLPEHMGRYICNIKSFAFPGTFYQKELLFEHGEWQGNNEVTHWMPLPEPPKGE